ncbi:MAG: hypothetical protein ACFE94_09135 [Candidatus Hodarchaeota archaeon]
MSKNRDALKFFQAYINEMIDVGGINLPKSISASLGAKLGKILKERETLSLEERLKKIYSALNAKTKITSIDKNTREIMIKFRSNFCPIGGKYNPDRADIIRNSICKPYTKAILRSLDPDTKYTTELMDCILKSNKKNCQYLLSVKE